MQAADIAGIEVQQCVFDNPGCFVVLEEALAEICFDAGRRADRGHYDALDDACAVAVRNVAA